MRRRQRRGQPSRHRPVTSQDPITVRALARVGKDALFDRGFEKTESRVRHQLSHRGAIHGVRRYHRTPRADPRR